MTTKSFAVKHYTPLFLKQQQQQAECFLSHTAGSVSAVGVTETTLACSGRGMQREFVFKQCLVVLNW